MLLRPLALASRTIALVASRANSLVFSAFRAISRPALAFTFAMFALALVALPGCSATSAALENDDAGTPPDLAYEVELVREPELAVRISLRVRGASDGATTFSLDEGWGGVSNAGESIHDLTITGAAGETLRLEVPSGHEWRVRHAADEALTVSYRLLANERQSSSDPSIHYGPILNAKLFHMIGNLGLLRPAHLDGEEPRSIRFAWKGFDAAGWRVASSFSVAPAGFRVRASLDDFRQAVFLAGALRVYSKTVHGRPISIAIAGREFDFDDGEFVALAAEIVETERAFFDDWNVPHYLISLIPVGKKEPGRTSLGGTGLTQSFATFMLPGMELKAGSRDALLVQHLLAHEMFHQWNGRIVRRVDPEQLVYWFSEGFTEFFARRILYRAGRLTLDQYARDLDDSLARYMLSSVRNAPDQRIVDDFWKDRAVADLPYRRGDVVALMVDHAIRARTHGEKSLDDLMREIVARGRTGTRVDNALLFSDIARATDADFAARVSRIIVDGETAELDPGTFEPCLALRMEALGPYELGFDLDKSVKDGVLRGVRSGTRAYSAGLREGQRLCACSVRGNQPDVPVELEIIDGSTRRKLSWLPQGETLAVPQFSVREPGKRSACEQL
jgi:predicted metalloprotease with PDZ domain